MKKHLNHLFISIIVVLLGATSSVAPVYANASVSVNYYAFRTPYLYTGTSCTTDASKSFILGACLVGQTGLMWNGGAVPVKAGQMVQINLSVYNTIGNNALDAYVSRITRLISSPLVYFGGAEYQQLSEGNGRISILGYISNSGNMSFIDIVGGQDGNGVYTWAQLFASEAISFESIVWWDVNTGGSGGGNIQWTDLRPHLDAIQLEIRQKTNEIGDLLRAQQQNQQQQIEAINNINNDQKEAGEQAQADGQTAADTAGTDAEQNTATMFSTLGDIVGVFKDTPAGDCTININFGQGRPNLGDLNFCQGDIEPIRPVIKAVIYLAMAVGTYKLLMWVVGAIAGLINWVQTGNGGGSE